MKKKKSQPLCMYLCDTDTSHHPEPEEINEISTGGTTSSSGHDDDFGNHEIN